jgi:hypothetical protein
MNIFIMLLLTFNCSDKFQDTQKECYQESKACFEKFVEISDLPKKEIAKLCVDQYGIDSGETERLRYKEIEFRCSYECDYQKVCIEECIDRLDQ